MTTMYNRGKGVDVAGVPYDLYRIEFDMGVGSDFADDQGRMIKGYGVSMVKESPGQSRK